MAGEFVSLLIFPISNALERILWRASSPWLTRKTLMRIGFQMPTAHQGGSDAKGYYLRHHRELGRHREDEKILGISDKTLLSLKNHTTMFREGQDWRRKGVSARSPLQWNVESTEQAFTNWVPCAAPWRPSSMGLSDEQHNKNGPPLREADRRIE